MALYWQNRILNTFDKVAAHYDAIKPLRGKHKNDNVRPIGDRNRKDERIKKINENCYVLMDGGYSGGDDVFGYHYYSFTTKAKPTEAEIVKLAPIVWRRYKDGSDTITIRNGSGQGSHNRRYSFLDRHLPYDLKFVIRSGKHFVKHLGHEYYLAKSNTVAKCILPENMLDHHGNAYRRTQYNKDLTSRDDGVALTFRITNGVMSFEDGGKPLPVPPKVRVDKEAKAKMKDAIAEFREWAFTMYPLLPYRDHEYAKRIRDEVSDAVGGNKYGWGWNTLSKFADNSEIVCKIICDPDHDLRLHLMYSIMGSTDYHLKHMFETSEEHIKAVKAQFNARINKTCGFNKKVKG
jgi:hypothetical protein